MTDPIPQAMQAAERLNNVPVTRSIFPLGVPVVIEAITDLASGWDFDAPMHVMTPFHRYCIVGSISDQTLVDEVEELLVNLSCGMEISSDANTWPYDEGHLLSMFSMAKRGNILSDVRLDRVVVTVTDWGDADGDGKWTIAAAAP